MIVGIAQVVEAAHRGGFDIPIAISKLLTGPRSGLNKATATNEATYGKNSTERKNTRPFNFLFIKIARNNAKPKVRGTVTTV